MNFVSKYLSKISMYMGMLFFLCGLLGVAVVFSVLDFVSYNTSNIVLQTIFFILACGVFNFGVARLLKVKINPESAVITGLILSAIMGPLTLSGDWEVLLFVSLAAVVSKYIFVVNKLHIFNPAAFGAVASALVMGYPASWWIGTSSMVPFLLAGGLVVILKTRFLNLVAGFFGTYAFLLALYFVLVQKMPFLDSLFQAGNFAFSAPLLFFAFVMLVEPLTAPETKNKRLYYGVFVASVLFALQNFVPQIPYSLELSLLAGNLFTLALKRNMRQTFTLSRKEVATPNIENFWFKREKHFNFMPGQYLEYTLEHKRPGGRGSRRFFTIASSPTEEDVLLTTKFSIPGSSFKRKLRSMKKGDRMVAAKISGDFVPPADTAEKLVFIAGGIGVTPFRSMVKYFIDKNESRDVILLYAVNKKEDAVFRDIFEEAKKRFGMKSVYITERIDADIIKKEVPDFEERTFYISGPEPMVKSIERVLTKIKMPLKRIKRDYFPGYK
ncbi:MAG: hypothetical protein WDZ40_02540 [Candidatus Spechtbacterales bacterium]